MKLEQIMEKLLEQMTQTLDAKRIQRLASAYESLAVAKAMEGKVEP